MQAGALDLLDVKTIAALRNVDVVMRSGLGRMSHYQQVSDALIQPNLDQEITFFYDPATKQLRKRFAIYPKALEAGASFLHDLARAYSELLVQVRAERQRH